MLVCKYIYCDTEFEPRDFRQLYCTRKHALQQSREVDRNRKLAKADDIKLASGCIDCDGVEWPAIALQFDHRPGTDKVAPISTLIFNGKSWDTIQQEIDKCDVRCANHHAIVTDARRQSLRASL